MSDLITLNGGASNDLSLAEALEAALPVLEDQETVALLYSPGACSLARLKNKHLFDCQGNPVALDEFYEARIFNEEAELRWLNESTGRGRGVLLSESTIPEPCQKQFNEEASLKAVEPWPQTYLLWGEGVRRQANTGLVKGWSRLTTARIGRLDVPVNDLTDAVVTEDKSKMPRVFLHVREYLQVCDEHGNVAVVEERLLKLKEA